MVLTKKRALVFFVALLRSGSLGNLENIKSHSFAERSAFANGNDIADLNVPEMNEVHKILKVCLEFYRDSYYENLISVDDYLNFNLFSEDRRQYHHDNLSIFYSTFVLYLG